ncbi:unnamed protein product [Protopolystoma xenopodis]|uniref:Uncharacterized protein n=1 Tax=Protopolystoma xenopodis TaxID=117903 RepID=A0A448WJJ9_9PLAT|nr:unnamed protein product [Protopolystoma xenopodis]
MINSFRYKSRTKWKRQTAVGFELLAEAGNFLAVQQILQTNPYWAYHPAAQSILSSMNTISARQHNTPSLSPLVLEHGQPQQVQQQHLQQKQGAFSHTIPPSAVAYIHTPHSLSLQPTNAGAMMTSTNEDKGATPPSETAMLHLPFNGRFDTINEGETKMQSESKTHTYSPIWTDTKTDDLAPGCSNRSEPLLNSGDSHGVKHLNSVPSWSMPETLLASMMFCSPATIASQQELYSAGSEDNCSLSLTQLHELMALETRGLTLDQSSKLSSTSSRSVEPVSTAMKMIMSTPRVEISSSKSGQALLNHLPKRSNECSNPNQCEVATVTTITDPGQLLCLLMSK